LRLKAPSTGSPASIAERSAFASTACAGLYSDVTRPAAPARPVRPTCTRNERLHPVQPHCVQGRAVCDCCYAAVHSTPRHRMTGCPCVSMRPHMAWCGTVNAWHNTAAVPCPHPVQKVDRACCKVGLDNVRDSRNVDAARGRVCGHQHNAVPAEEQEAHWRSPAARALSDLYEPVRHTKHRQQRSRQRGHRHWRKATEHPRLLTRTRAPPTHI